MLLQKLTKLNRNQLVSFLLAFEKIRVFFSCQPYLFKVIIKVLEIFMGFVQVPFMVTLKRYLPIRIVYFEKYFAYWFMLIQILYINPFNASFPFLYPLKTS